MAGFNKVIIVGNLTRDPEYKQLASGQALCKIGIASNRSFKNRQTGTMVQEVCYVDVDVWGAQAESCRQYLSKGRAVLVEGRLKLDTWQDAQGATRSKHSIAADSVVFLGSGKDGQAASDFDGSLTSEPTEAPVSYSTQKTEEFMKVEQAIAKKQAAKKAATEIKKDDSKVQGSAEFKDEPPFEEELPF